MARIVGGGGKSGSSNRSVGRPGFGRLLPGETSRKRGFTRSVKRLFARDPANGVTALAGKAGDAALINENALTGDGQSATVIGRKDQRGRTRGVVSVRDRSANTRIKKN